MMTVRQRGVALITAMMITALATIVAANLAWDNALDLRRTNVQLNFDQAGLVAIGAEGWVGTILKQDLIDSDTDHLGEIWAVELPGLPIDGGELVGRVVDLQGRFNINNLVDEQGAVSIRDVAQFQRLLAVLDIDPALAGYAADWLDADLEPGFPNGAEDSVYTGKIPAYRTANRRISSTAELAAIEGMTRESMERLLPHIAALPGRTAINVNTATPAVLQSLGEDIGPGDVERLLSERESGGFVDITTSFSSLVEAEQMGRLATASNYFQLIVVVRIDTVHYMLYSVLERGPNGIVTPILRSIGTE